MNPRLLELANINDELISQLSGVVGVLLSAMDESNGTMPTTENVNWSLILIANIIDQIGTNHNELWDLIRG